MTTEEGAAATSPTATPGDVSTDRFDGSHSGAGRLARWLASWRVAIRIARRDARRYKWRSALIVVMVGLPVLLLTSGITLMATNDVNMAESVPRVMGSAQARVHDSGVGRTVQSPDARSTGSDSGGGKATIALAVPGFAPDSAWTSGKVQKLTGGRVIRSLDATMRVTLGDRRPNTPVLGIDARDPLARGMADLTSGRWARTTSEIVVTEAGIANGLPRRGTLLTTGPKGRPRPLRVVGVAVAHPDAAPLPFIVALPDLLTDAAQSGSVTLGFLVGRPSPVTWSDVHRMNGYGLLVQSRQVLLDPPSTAELDPKIAQTMGSSQGRFDLVMLIAAVGLFIETTLLAGPAFAVSAARQRRSLALAAVNGAEARQLRRYVLGQAVVLGVVSAAVAVVAGVMLAFLGLSWWQAGHADFVTGPFEVSWARVAGVFVCSLVASMVAALLPARGIARLDIVSVLAGRSGDRTIHRGLPVVGVVVMVVSGGAIIWSASGGGASLSSTYLVAGGAVFLVLGCLMLIPALLVLVGRLGTRLVLPLRLAARDTARQRTRSTPAVAAIMAAVAALTALSVGAASDTRQREIEYRAQLPMGHGRIWISPELDQPSVRSLITARAPELVVSTVSTVGQAEPMEQGMTKGGLASGSRLEVVAAKPPGCSDAAVFGAFGGADGVPVDPRCARLGGGAQRQNAQIMVVSLETLVATKAVSDAERHTLQAGGALVFDPVLMTGGFVDFVTGRTKTGTMDKPTEMPVVTSRQRVPASAIDRKAWQPVLTDGQAGAWVLPATAARLGWAVTPNYLDVISPTGMISEAAESAINDRLDDEYPMQVERGFQNDSWLILLILFSVAGSLVLIASLISTALSMAESQNDMATLAAVGATRHTRRGIAASQAFVVAACGCVLGLLVGLVPGIAITWPLTTQGWDPVTAQQLIRPPTIVIPWLHLMAICAGVPLLAAGLAWLAVRRRPEMTRRLV